MGKCNSDRGGGGLSCAKEAQRDPPGLREELRWAHRDGGEAGGPGRTCPTNMPPRALTRMGNSVPAVHLQARIPGLNNDLSGLRGELLPSGPRLFPWNEE